MEFSIPGFIKEYCTPNALLTLEEYLVDYASPETREVGERLIAAELAKLPDGDTKDMVVKRLKSIKESGDHDIYF
jgi:2-iminoacetate synthase